MMRTHHAGHGPEEDGMSGQQEFHLSAILSVTTGVLVCEMDSLYRIINYLTGDDISTIGLLSAAEPCKAALLEQLPQLAAIDARGVNGQTWRAWLSEQVAHYGAMHPVTPMSQWEKRTVVDDILDVNRLNPNAGVLVLGEPADVAR